MNTQNTQTTGNSLIPNETAAEKKGNLIQKIVTSMALRAIEYVNSVFNGGIQRAAEVYAETLAPKVEGNKNLFLKLLKRGKATGIQAGNTVKDLMIARLTYGIDIQLQIWVTLFKEQVEKAIDDPAFLAVVVRSISKINGVEFPYECFAKFLTTFNMEECDPLALSISDNSKYGDYFIEIPFDYIQGMYETNPDITIEELVMWFLIENLGKYNKYGLLGEPEIVYCDAQ